MRVLFLRDDKPFLKGQEYDLPYMEAEKFIRQGAAVRSESDFSDDPEDGDGDGDPTNDAA